MNTRPTLTGIGTVLLWAALLGLAFVGIPAFDAWLSADPLRPVALGVGGLALVTLAVVRLEVGE